MGGAELAELPHKLELLQELLGSPRFWGPQKDLWAPRVGQWVVGWPMPTLYSAALNLGCEVPQDQEEGTDRGFECHTPSLARQRSCLWGGGVTLAAWDGPCRRGRKR